MNRFFTTFLFALLTTFVVAQGTVTGTVVDTDSHEALIGATVSIKGSADGSITNLSGNFTLEKVPAGQQVVVVSFTGFETQEIFVTVVNGKTVDAGTLRLGFAQIGLEEINVIASVAVDRKTPIAVSTIKGEEIEALIGNQEFPEVLRHTPSIYVTKEGGGFGDSRINVRGFDQRNVAVMINGIPVNDMENGWVYWSNWAGLSDVTSNMQVQRGLGATKLAVASVGGSINIITNAAEMKKGGKVSISAGNDGYQKYGLSLSSGLGDNGWAFTAQGTHTRGNGYVDGAEFEAYSYFLSLSKIVNDQHSISITALGAPQWHHQRTVGRFDGVTLRTYVDPDNTGETLTDMGVKYNQNWGYKNGEVFSWRRNFYHKPKAFINHYWNISPRTDLKTSAYVSFGRGGGSGPRGRINGSFDTSSKFKNDESGYAENGSVKWDDIVTWNSGGSVPAFGDDKLTWGELDGGVHDNRNGSFADSYVNTSSNGFVRRASVNSHNWYGVLSTLNHDINNYLTFVGGIDFRYYRGIHYRRMDNLLGADAYFTNRNINNAGNFITQEKESKAFANLQDDQKLNYQNDGIVQWSGVFAQVEFDQDKISAFASFTGSNQGFRRVDYFNYFDGDDTDGDGNPKQFSDWENFLGGTAKAGLNYNINNLHNVYINGGIFSKQPQFDNVFPDFNNDVDLEVQNQRVSAIEVGYGLRMKDLSLNFNFYNTVWDNRQITRSFQGELNGVLIEDGVANFNNIGERHTGLELDLVYKPLKGLTINGMASVANWEYTSIFNAEVIDLQTGTNSGEKLTIYGDGLQVGDAAQNTYSLAVSYEIIDGLNIRASYFNADRLFAQFDISDSAFQSEETSKVSELPRYSLVDAGMSYRFNFSGTAWTLRFNVNNVLDNIYVAELDTNIQDDPTTDRNEFYDNRGFFGFGRTWNVGLKIAF